MWINLSSFLIGGLFVCLLMTTTTTCRFSTSHCVWSLCILIPRCSLIGNELKANNFPLCEGETSLAVGGKVGHFHPNQVFFNCRHQYFPLTDPLFLPSKIVSVSFIFNLGRLNQFFDFVYIQLAFFSTVCYDFWFYSYNASVVVGSLERFYIGEK
jgi:hypothetical protein